MIYKEYLQSVSEEMILKSNRIKNDFSTHRPSSGDNKEDIVAQFLSDHLPKKFTVSTGIVFSSGGQFSKQADLIIADGYNNAPLYAKYSNELWPVEAVYAIIEVKSELSLTQLRDSIEKGREFKRLPRQVSNSGNAKIKEPLFAIWGYSSPSPETLSKNLEELLSQVPIAEQPDLIIIPGEVVVQSGNMRQLSKIGQPNSPHRRMLEEQHGPDLSNLFKGNADVWLYKEHSLLTWYIWLDSWLRGANERHSDPNQYIPSDIRAALQADITALTKPL